MNKELQQYINKADNSQNIKYFENMMNALYNKAYEYRKLRDEAVISNKDLRGKYVRLSKERDYGNPVYMHVVNQFVTNDGGRDRYQVYLEGLTFRYSDATIYLDNIWQEVDGCRQIHYDIHEFENLQVKYLTEGEFRKLYMEMVSNMVSIYEHAEKLINNKISSK